MSVHTEIEYHYAIACNEIINDPDPRHNDRWYAVFAGTRVGVFQYW